MARGEVQIGRWKWPGGAPSGRGLAVVKYKSSAKITKTESKGKDDARTEYNGKKPCDLHITFRWNDDGSKIDGYATDMLADLSPRGPNAGLPLEFVDGNPQDQKIHRVYKIEVEELDGPERTPGTSEVTATIGCSSWVKPAPGPAVTTTPTVAQPWGTPQQVAGAATPKPGFAATPPKVTP